MHCRCILVIKGLNPLISVLLLAVNACWGFIQAAINRQRCILTRAKGFGEKGVEEDTKSTVEDEVQAPMV